MDLWYIVPALYLLITLWAGVMTYCEQCRTAGRSRAFNVIGLLVCAVWPLVVTAILISPKPKGDYT
jgi:hypothetical protein